jgi:putative ABC transport system permease protein
MQGYLLTIKLALRGLLVNKGRSILTMLGIIIGVSSVIIIISVGAGAQSLITNSLKSMGTNLIGVLPGKSDDKGPPVSVLGIVITTLTYDDAKAVASLPHIVGVSAYSKGVGTISAGNRSTDSTFNGITASYPKVENHKVALGRFLTSEEETGAAKVAVLGADIKETLFPATNPLGEKIKIKEEAFTVIGVMERKGSSLVGSVDGQVFVPITAAQKLLLGVHHIGFMRVKVDDEKNVTVVMHSVKQLLRYRHKIKDPADDDFTVRSMSQALDTFTAVTNALTLFLSFIAAISLIVGGIGIMNIMLMTVQERTREIGLRKAIGATPSLIQNQFVVESMVLTGIGGIVGMVIGVSVSYLIAVIANNMGYNWDFVIPPISLLVSFSVSLFVGLVFGLYPARKAARLNPIEALRYE